MLLRWLPAPENQQKNPNTSQLQTEKRVLPPGRLVSSTLRRRKLGTNSQSQMRKMAEQIGRYAAVSPNTDKNPRVIPP